MGCWWMPFAVVDSRVGQLRGLSPPEMMLMFLGRMVVVIQLSFRNFLFFLSRWILLFSGLIISFTCPPWATSYKWRQKWYDEKLLLIWNAKMDDDEAKVGWCGSDWGGDYWGQVVDTQSVHTRKRVRKCQELYDRDPLMLKLYKGGCRKNTKTLNNERFFSPFLVILEYLYM